LNFVKRTRAHKELSTIGYNYLTGFFIFDVIATLPELFLQERMDYYVLKLFRIIHFTKLT
jgi:CRP-like cAMP-binding protein